MTVTRPADRLQENLRYTIRRESGFLETVEDHNVLGSQAIY